MDNTRLINLLNTDILRYRQLIHVEAQLMTQCLATSAIKLMFEELLAMGSDQSNTYNRLWHWVSPTIHWVMVYKDLEAIQFCRIPAEVVNPNATVDDEPYYDLMINQERKNLQALDIFDVVAPFYFSYIKEVKSPETRPRVTSKRSIKAKAGAKKRLRQEP